jgi:hypothetical protein
MQDPGERKSGAYGPKSEAPRRLHAQSLVELGLGRVKRGTVA